MCQNKIFDIIQENKGITAPEIKKKLTTTTNVNVGLNQLERFGLIKSELKQIQQTTKTGQKQTRLLKKYYII